MLAWLLAEAEFPCGVSVQTVKTDQRGTKHCTTLRVHHHVPPPSILPSVSLHHRLPLSDSYSNAQISISCRTKSSFWDRRGFPKVLQGLLRPWYRSPSSQRPNSPLQRPAETLNFRLFCLILNWSDLSAVRVCVCVCVCYSPSPSECQGVHISLQEKHVVSSPLKHLKNTHPHTHSGLDPSPSSSGCLNKSF